jgi:hypothetical protein
MKRGIWHSIVPLVGLAMIACVSVVAAASRDASGIPAKCQQDLRDARDATSNFMRETHLGFFAACMCNEREDRQACDYYKNLMAEIQRALRGGSTIFGIMQGFNEDEASRQQHRKTILQELGLVDGRP